jgi:uncharacterized protein (TIGR03000 family)
MAALTTSTADATSFGWLHGCHGCNGCNGCNGWGGCHGGWGWRGCHGWGGGGCCGCYGGGYGGCHGCYGGYGGGYGGCFGMVSYTGCIGGCHSNYAPVPQGSPAPRKPPEKIMKPADKESAAPKEAKLIVDLPADAKLFIDDQPMQVTNQHPVFVTPGLQTGKTYYYDVRAEIMREGKPVSDTKRVVFHAGDELRESFVSLENKTAEKVAGIK